jgi:hypothetical protein
VQQNELQFTCQKCGDHELSYQKYAKCLTPVTVKNNNNLEYSQSMIDEDDYLAIQNGFACRSCGSLIEHCGVRMETEKQLIDYLTMEPFGRQRQQQEYEELMIAESDEQEQKEKEQENCITMK